MPTSPASSPASSSPAGVSGRRPGAIARRYVWSVSFSVVGIAIAVVLTTLIAHDRPRFGILARDPLTVARSGGNLPYYTGWVTYLGAVGWIGAAAIGVLVGVFLHQLRHHGEGNVLVLGGGISLLLGLDDLMMFHDTWLSEKGVPENVTMVFLIAPALLWGLVYFRRLLRGPETPLLVVAALLFAHSLVVEEIGPFLFHEEAAKAGAICCWALWFWLRALRSLRGAFAAAPAAPNASDTAP